MRELHFTIDGMHCDACVERVSRMLGRIPDTVVEEVKVGSARLRVSAADEQACLDAIRKAGFEACLVR